MCTEFEKLKLKLNDNDDNDGFIRVFQRYRSIVESTIKGNTLLTANNMTKIQCKL